MKSLMFLKNSFISIFIPVTLISVCVGFGENVWAQGTAEPPTSMNLVRNDTVEDFDAGSYPGLFAPVSFEVKQCPLPDLLVELQKQTGISMALEPNSHLASKRVTARVQNLSLGKVLDSLQVLYGESWEKVNDGYLLGKPVPVLDALLIPLGNLEWYRYWQQPARREVAPKELTFEPLINWSAEIAPYVSLAKLQMKGGVPLAILPLELQLKLRRDIEERATLGLINRLSQVSSWQLKDDTLCIVFDGTKNGGTSSITQVAVRSSSETSIVNLFNPPRLSPRQPDQTH